MHWLTGSHGDWVRRGLCEARVSGIGFRPWDEGGTGGLMNAPVIRTWEYLGRAMSPLVGSIRIDIEVKVLNHYPSHHQTLLEPQQCPPQQPNTSTSPTSSGARCSVSPSTTSKRRATSPSHKSPTLRHHRQQQHRPTPETPRLHPACPASRKASDEPSVTVWT